jgi:enoyl-CoA hydratase/carnithine racemase
MTETTDARTEGLRITGPADGVLVAELDRPPENLLTVDLCRRLTGLLTEPPPGTHVLRLRATGAAFCLGRERAGSTPGELRAEARVLTRLHQAQRHSEVVTVAEVHGDAAGFGAGLVACCDVAIATADAGFSFPEVSIGLAPAVVLAWLPRLVGERTAFWLTATGERITAERAAGLGLVDAVVADERALRAEGDARVAALRAYHPRVHAEIKETLRLMAPMDADTALDASVDRLVVAAQRRTE